MTTDGKFKEGISYARQSILNVPTQSLCTYTRTSDDEPHGAKIVASDKMEYFFANNCKIVVMCDAERTGEASTNENFVNLRV